MKYTWMTYGDQDEAIRRICPLGPYMLELVEARWIGHDTNAIMLVDFNVYKWDESVKEYLAVDTDLKQEIYNREMSHTVLEDWYACNVLSEDYFVGREDEVVQSSNLQG